MGDNGIRINLGLTPDDLMDGKLSLEERYGKYYPLLLDPKTREEGYKKIDHLFKNGYSEAGIVLGQYYYQTDRAKAMRYFEVPAKENNAEALWGLSGCIEHNHIPQANNVNDNKWVSTVIRAAQLGCPDAMNEAGNIENRRGNYFLSAYWYGLAELYEHPQALYGCKGIAKKWNEAGRPAPPAELSDNPLCKQGEFMIKTDADTDQQTAFNNIFAVANNEDFSTLALFTAKVAEMNNDLETAYKYYQIAAMEGDIYANRACADMLMVGNGCPKDPNTAVKLYSHAASQGEKNSCFVMGELERNNGNVYKANAWYAKASVRGFELANNRIK